MGVATVLLRYLLGARRPLTDGVLTVAGIGGPVTLRRDPWHVPHVEAGNWPDGCYGLGFAQGQDRAFQVELLVRLARGTLSELVGRGGLPADRLTRRLGLTHHARNQLPALDTAVRRQIEAFATGVTDGATRGSPRRAHEFVLLRSRPTPVTPVDVLAVGKLTAFLLAGNWEMELARLEVLRGDGAEALTALEAPAGAGTPGATAHDVALDAPLADRVAGDLAVLRRAAGLAGASNAWAVAGGRTASGGPVVANDTHLPPQLPPPFHLAHVSTPDVEVTGAVLVASPVFAAGSNGHAAWGVTAAQTDVCDLFVEEIGPDGRSVREGGQWVACPVRREVIRVRGGDDTVEEVLDTPRGPVVSPALPGRDRALSLSGTFLDARPLRGFFGLPRARDVPAFRRLFTTWPSVPLNVVWADRDGHIAWQLVGDVPLRRTGSGTLPLPGGDPEVGWEGRVPFPDMPHLVDPPGGIIVTANNRPASAGDGPFVGADFFDAYRAEILAGTLHRRGDWDTRATMRLQTDRTSLPFQQVREALLQADTPTGEARLARRLLAGWHGRVTADSPGAAVFELALADLTCRVVRSRAPVAGDWLLGAPTSPFQPTGSPGARRVAHVCHLLTTRPDGWFPDPWPAVVGRSLEAAVRSLRSAHGPDPSRWTWGRVRPVHLRHLASAGLGPLRAAVDRGPVPLGGDTNTVTQATVSPLDPTGEPMAIPTMRMAVDLADPESSRFVLAGGQSGNPTSPHYDDLIGPWRDGEGIPIPRGRRATRRAATHHLSLLPTAPPQA